MQHYYDVFVCVCGGGGGGGGGGWHEETLIFDEEYTAVCEASVFICQSENNHFSLAKRMKL